MGPMATMVILLLRNLMFRMLHLHDYSFPAAEGNIKYAGIDSASKNVDETTAYPGVLLTYNANPNNKSSGTEKGTTTGVTANIVIDNARQAKLYTGPYRISANDMLKRKGFKGNNPALGIPEFFKRHAHD